MVCPPSLAHISIHTPRMVVDDFVRYFRLYHELAVSMDHFVSYHMLHNLGDHSQVRSQFSHTVPKDSLTYAPVEAVDGRRHTAIHR
jgi:hypothetical protein